MGVNKLLFTQEEEKKIVIKIIKLRDEEKLSFNIISQRFNMSRSQVNNRYNKYKGKDFDKIFQKNFKSRTSNKSNLTENDIRKIRLLYRTEQKSYKVISNMYKPISISSIRNICNLITWNHVI